MAHLYLRRFKRAHLKIQTQSGQSSVVGLTPDAVECDDDDADDGLSLANRIKGLDEPIGVVLYQRTFRFDSGDLPGVASLNLEQIVAARIVNKPKFSPVEGPFGKHHFVIPCPNEEVQDRLCSTLRIELFPVDAKYAIDDLPDPYEFVQSKGGSVQRPE